MMADAKITSGWSGVSRRDAYWVAYQKLVRDNKIYMPFEEWLVENLDWCYRALNKIKREANDVLPDWLADAE